MKPFRRTITFQLEASDEQKQELSATYVHIQEAYRLLARAMLSQSDFTSAYDRMRENWPQLNSKTFQHIRDYASAYPRSRSCPIIADYQSFDLSISDKARLRIWKETYDLRARHIDRIAKDGIRMCKAMIFPVGKGTWRVRFVYDLLPSKRARGHIVGLYVCSDYVALSNGRVWKMKQIAHVAREKAKGAWPKKNWRGYMMSMCGSIAKMIIEHCESSGISRLATQPINYENGFVERNEHENQLISYLRARAEEHGIEIVTVKTLRTIEPTHDQNTNSTIISNANIILSAFSR